MEHWHKMDLVYPPHRTQCKTAASGLLFLYMYSCKKLLDGGKKSFLFIWHCLCLEYCTDLALHSKSIVWLMMDTKNRLKSMLQNQRYSLIFIPHIIPPQPTGCLQYPKIFSFSSLKWQHLRQFNRFSPLKYFINENQCCWHNYYMF